MWIRTPHALLVFTEQPRPTTRRSTFKGREVAISSDQHWASFKGKIEETHERRGGAHMGFPEGTDSILN